MKLRWPRVLVLSLALSTIPLTVVWQDYRLDRERQALYSLLQKASVQARATGPVTVRFTSYSATLEAPDGGVIERLFLYTLNEVRYQTTLGDRRIVYSAGGDTSPYNIHLHGGDISLRSWLGRERSLWVHCTGGVTEGRNGDWERSAR